MLISSKHGGTSLLSCDGNPQRWHVLRHRILKDQPGEVHVPVLCGPWEFLTKIWVCRVVINYRIWELVVCDQSTYLWPAVTSFWSQNFRPQKSCSELHETQKNEEKNLTKIYSQITIRDLVSGCERHEHDSRPETKFQSRCRLPRKFLVNFLFDFFMFHEILDIFWKTQFPVF